jgi:hypothetical protein
MYMPPTSLYESESWKNEKRCKQNAVSRFEKLKDGERLFYTRPGKNWRYQEITENTPGTR